MQPLMSSLPVSLIPRIKMLALSQGLSILEVSLSTEGLPIITHVENFGNLGFVLGTSRLLFNEVCTLFRSDNMNSMDTANLLTPFIGKLRYVPQSAIYTQGILIRPSSTCRHR